MLMRTTPPTQEWRDNLAAAITDEERYGVDPVERGINAAIQFFVTRTKELDLELQPIAIMSLELAATYDEISGRDLTT
jgi:hypothetical protein